MFGVRHVAIMPVMHICRFNVHFDMCIMTHVIPLSLTWYTYLFIMGHGGHAMLLAVCHSNSLWVKANTW